MAILHVWAYQLVDRDNDELVIDDMRLWVVWEDLDNMFIDLENTVLDYFKICLDNDVILSESQILHIKMQLRDFHNNTVEPGVDRRFNVELYDFYNNSTDKSIEIVVWTLILKISK